MPIIAGVDEAGRGALAGPVVAAACVFDEALSACAPLITDSKLMTSLQRENAYEHLVAHCPYGVSAIDADVVDAQGILAATERAMQEAVSILCRDVCVTYLLVDGRDKFWFDMPHSSVVRGDQKEVCIAAASIIAKVTRDRLMQQYDEEFPGYGFAVHKGYGTESHFLNIQKNGFCSLHRRTFLSKMNVR